MDAEGLGRKLLLTFSGGPCRTPEKQTLDTVTASHETAHPASTFKLSQCRHCKEGLPGPRRDIWVPSGSLSPASVRTFFVRNFDFVLRERGSKDLS